MFARNQYWTESIKQYQLILCLTYKNKPFIKSIFKLTLFSVPLSIINFRILSAIVLSDFDEELSATGLGDSKYKINEKLNIIYQAIYVLWVKISPLNKLIYVKYLEACINTSKDMQYLFRQEVIQSSVIVISTLSFV